MVEIKTSIFKTSCLPNGESIAYIGCMTHVYASDIDSQIF